MHLGQAGGGALRDPTQPQPWTPALPHQDSGGGPQAQGTLCADSHCSTPIFSGFSCPEVLEPVGGTERTKGEGPRNCLGPRGGGLHGASGLKSPWVVVETKALNSEGGRGGREGR